METEYIAQSSNSLNPKERELLKNFMYQKKPRLAVLANYAKNESISKHLLSTHHRNSW